MTEEQVTKIILEWLLNSNWIIVSFDFPQSGTGKILHPNDSLSEKNKGSINPDIIAVKETICLFFENKGYFYYSDFLKQYNLINNNDYSNDIEKLLKDYNIKNIYYGIGMPSEKHSQRSVNSAYLVDFIIGVNKQNKIDILFNKYNISI